MGRETTDNEQSGGISRRTLTKAMAWAVPTVAVAATLPTAAASHHEPSPPVFQWTGGCATTGSGGGCANGDKTPQVPFTIHNPTAETVYLQILGQKSWIGNGPAPAAWSPLGGIYANNGTQNNCGPRLDTVTCGYPSIKLDPGQSRSLWFVGSTMGSANDFSMAVQFRWVRANCEVIVPTAQVSSYMTPSNNCAK